MVSEHSEEVSDHSETVSGPAGPLPRTFGIALLAGAVTFAVASYLHTDGRIPLGFATVTGESFPGAVVPEAVIGSVLAVAAALVLARFRRARGAALAGAGFAIAGTLLGTMVVIGSRPGATADLTYHGLILAALVATFMLLLRWPGPRQRVRSR